jgi:hypothetical protein
MTLFSFLSLSLSLSEKKSSRRVKKIRERERKYNNDPLHDTFNIFNGMGINVQVIEKEAIRLGFILVWRMSRKTTNNCC